MRFISFEGIDGCGKSTLLSSLADHLRSKGQEVDVTREPGGTPLAEELRAMVLKVGNDAPTPRAELLIYEASRAQHVDKRILPALQSGKWVLTDRFFDSSVAFQGAGRSIPLAEVHWLNRFATAGLRPHLTVLLDCPVEVGHARRLQRLKPGSKPDRLESESKTFHDAVRAGFLALARSEPTRFLVLNAEKPPQILFEELLQDLRSKGWLQK